MIFKKDKVELKVSGRSRGGFPRGHYGVDDACRSPASDDSNYTKADISNDINNRRTEMKVVSNIQVCDCMSHSKLRIVCHRVLDAIKRLAWAIVASSECQAIMIYSIDLSQSSL